MILVLVLIAIGIDHMQDGASLHAFLDFGMAAIWVAIRPAKKGA